MNTKKYNLFKENRLLHMSIGAGIGEVLGKISIGLLSEAKNLILSQGGLTFLGTLLGGKAFLNWRKKRKIKKEKIAEEIANGTYKGLPKRVVEKLVKGGTNLPKWMYNKLPEGLRNTTGKIASGVAFPVLTPFRGVGATINQIGNTKDLILSTPKIAINTASTIGKTAANTGIGIWNTIKGTVKLGAKAITQPLSEFLQGDQPNPMTQLLEKTKILDKTEYVHTNENIKNVFDPIKTYAGETHKNIMYILSGKSDTNKPDTVIQSKVSSANSADNTGDTDKDEDN